MSIEKDEEAELPRISNGDCPPPYDYENEDTGMIPESVDSGLEARIVGGQHMLVWATEYYDIAEGMFEERKPGSWYDIEFRDISIIGFSALSSVVATKFVMPELPTIMSHTINFGADFLNGFCSGVANWGTAP